MPTLLDRPMTSLREALRPKRASTPEEDATIRFVRDLAAEWDAGRLPLSECRRLSTGPKRWLTTRFTPPDDPAYPPLMRLLDALIEATSTPEGDTITTKHGQFSHDDFIDAEVKIERDDGQQLVCFPVRYPWKVRPAAEKGIEGVRGPAVYRSREERGPIYGTFAVKPAPERRDRAVPWWEEDDEA